MQQTLMLTESEIHFRPRAPRAYGAPLTLALNNDAGGGAVTNAALKGGIADAGEEGARVVETLTKLGTSSDYLRKRIDLGIESIQQSTAINEAFALKNETLGATIDKLGKEFNKLISSPGVSNFLKGAVEGAFQFVKALRTIPEWLDRNSLALKLLTAAVVLQNLEFIKRKAIVLLELVNLKALTSATGLQTIAQTASSAATAAGSAIMALFSGKIALAKKEFALLTAILRVNPFVLILGAIAVVLLAFDTFSNKVKETKDELQQLAIQQKLGSEIAAAAAENISGQVSRIEQLVNTIDAETTSLEGKNAPTTNSFN